MKWLNDSIKSLGFLIILVATYTYFFAILFIQKNVDPQVIIAIVAISSAATGYYYGSTSGSSKKDDIIANMSSPSPVGTTTTGDVNIDTKHLEDGKQ